ncbi:MAG: shikimate dehydrogenase [candidate division Zixibacteria bacterium]|nr:shikimate dehydrogenase [candidate division Zixibacteria bacterium]
MSNSFHFGLLGERVGYSLSPEIFDRIFCSDKVEGTFSVFDISGAELKSRMSELRQLDGFSVTIPHKERIIPYLDVIDDTAKKIGAVNSVAVKNGQLHGFNTDITGSIYPLIERRLQIKDVLIIGYGGAARAVIMGILENFNDCSITVTGRNYLTADGLTKDVIKSNMIATNRLKSIEISQLNDQSYDVAVNCTPVGNVNYIGEMPVPETYHLSQIQLCYDLNYKPVRTKFLECGIEAGCEVLNGVPMLIRQALESYSLWSGRNVNFERLYTELVSVYHGEIEGVI